MLAKDFYIPATGTFSFDASAIASTVGAFSACIPPLPNPTALKPQDGRSHKNANQLAKNEYANRLDEQ
jgi:hypothetical protein